MSLPGLTICVCCVLACSHIDYAAWDKLKCNCLIVACTQAATAVELSGLCLCFIMPCKPWTQQVNPAQSSVQVLHQLVIFASFLLCQFFAAGNQYLLVRRGHACCKSQAVQPMAKLQPQLLTFPCSMSIQTDSQSMYRSNRPYR